MNDCCWVLLELVVDVDSFDWVLLFVSCGEDGMMLLLLFVELLFSLWLWPFVGADSLSDSLGL